jgi:RNA polymerase subunit RPABC4/transcription elongation factor Spt4
MLFAAWGITRSFERKKEKLSGSFMLYVIGFSIFATLLAVTFIGNEVAWWRIRVNEQAYNIGDIAIPRMLATLMSTFFSSIIVLNMSISKGVKRARKELADAEKLNMNPGWLLKKRDGEISSLMSSIGFKGLIFVTIIGITIIFASDLSTYAPQGLIIILPFIVGAVITLALGAIMQRWMLRKKDEVIFDNLMPCPECHGTIAVGSSYCENCGKALISGTRSRIARACNRCQGLNPEDTKRCRFCGESLQ